MQNAQSIPPGTRVLYTGKVAGAPRTPLYAYPCSCDNVLCKRGVSGCLVLIDDVGRGQVRHTRLTSVTPV